MALAKIVLLTTGGTIAMQTKKADACAGASTLLQSIPQITSLAKIEHRDILSKGSSRLTLDDLRLLVNEVNAVKNADGIVVTCGTDTLEEIAFALQLLVKTAIPVVITGAMRKSDLPDADGPANIMDSCRVAISPDAKKKGILVVLNNEIHSALFVKKAHSFLPNAFQSLGPLGWVAEDRVRFLLAPAASPPRLSLGVKAPLVPLIEAGFNFDEKLLSLMQLHKADGVVINMCGVGHITDTVVRHLQELAGRKPLVFSSRTGQGETFRHTYLGAGSESDLIKQGLIPAGFLNGRQARVALMLLLSNGASPNKIGKFYEFFSL